MKNAIATAANHDRKELHNWIDIIGEASLPEIRWLLQGYVARELNRRYREEQQQK